MIDEIVLSDDAIQPLRQSIAYGPMIIKDGKYHQTIENAVVDRLNGLSIVINTKEHGMPHFHIIMGKSKASYDIKECKRLCGRGVILRYEKNIESWWNENQNTLIEAWNRLRPDDCSVGCYRG